MNEKYQDYHYSVAEKLVSEMTLEEKASQLCAQAPAIERLGIPEYHWWNEGLHGVARAGTATVFPQAIGLAATFDKEVLADVGKTTAIEGRTKYNLAKAHNDRAIYKGLTFWSPNINIYRDPRWGRGHETYGEDPVLTASCAESYIKAMQNGEDERFMPAAACLKHLAAHSGPEGCRHGFDSKVTDFDLYDTYLPAFEWNVKRSHVESVMGAYNTINGVHCCGNKQLMDDVLRKDWGFRGYYVSDCGALADMHMFCLVTHTAVESAALALKSGCDLNCGVVYLQVLQAYNEGLVTEEDITKSAVRVIATRSKLGMLEKTAYDKYQDIKLIECDEHLKKNYNAARKSVVMLKNNGILPLKPNKDMTIAVIGPNAVNQRALEGNYNGTASQYHYLPESIQKSSNGAKVLYAQGCHVYKDIIAGCAEKYDGFSEAVTIAEAADVVVLCMGLDPSIEGEQGDASNEYGAGDKLSLKFPGLQNELLEEIKKTNKPIILVTLAGGALELKRADEICDAILYGWYPGSLGLQAISDIIFGIHSPCGKTPVTFYKSADDIPEFEDYSMKGRTYRYFEKEPLYPFGYGLSYSEFSYEKASIKEVSEGFEAEVTVKNIGKAQADCVAEVYAVYGNEKYITPRCKLIGFDTVFLKAGEEKRIKIDICDKALLLTDKDGSRYMPQDKVEIFIGDCQPQFAKSKAQTELKL